MASGREEDPPQAQGRRGSHSEGRVAEETEEVFRGYALHLYRQEREERGVPEDPEMEQIQQDLESARSVVGQRLAVIGDDIYRRYNPEFCTMLDCLQPTRDNAYEHFTRIASSLFESGINWGRVIALLVFGYRLAMHVWQRGRARFLRSIARYLAEFMVQHRIALWIAQQGGWRAVLELDNVYVKYVLVAAALVLGHLVLRRLRSP